MNRSLGLGFIFFVALVILGFGTLMVQRGITIFEPSYNLRVKFQRIHGLRAGDEVRVEGVPYGSVEKIELGELGESASSGGGVLVTLRLRKDKAPLVLFTNYEIAIESSSVLGGNMVVIHRGGPPKHELLADPKALEKTTLEGTVRPGLDEVGKMVDENRENFRVLIANLKDVSQSLKEGHGTIGKILQSDELHNKVVASLEEVRKAAELANSRLRSEFVDATLSNLAEATANLKSITEALQKSEGPLGALINDKTMTQRLSKTLEDVQKTGENLRVITDKVQSGEGTLGKLINDRDMGEKLKRTVDNIEQSSESIKQITGKLQNGEGSVGKLLQDDELYEKAKQTMDDIDKTFAKAARSVIDIVVDSAYYPTSLETIGKLGVRLVPSDDKYIYVGVAAMSLDKNGPISFSRQVNDNQSDTLFRAEVLLGYRIPFLLDKRLTAWGGLYEGLPGGGLDFKWDQWGLFTHPVTFTFEAREGYSNVDKQKIDEHLNGAMMRARVRFPIWNRRDSFIELLLSSVNITAGVSRIGSQPEYLAGIGLEWPDDDIRTLVGFIALAH
jgi:phospholipid/cholesterol/gamma-HCH transport system substrate-binding protein